MMKSPLRKFRGLAGRKSEPREKRSPKKPWQIDEFVQANQDMDDIKKCYDSLFAAAAATENTAYEFSESLKELGSCLLEKTALNDDEDSGRVLLMLGKAQYQIQKFVDNYRSHISKTITRPSEFLLAELQTVEEMKHQCDAKRSAYEYMLFSQGERGKSKSARENVSPQELQAALDDYEDEANLFIFRLKSLKQGQSRTFLTQAARHHAAQMSFFKRSFHFLESVEPHVKVITEQQQIDYQFSGLEDDDAEDVDADGSDVNDDGELSSEDEQPQHVTESLTTTRHSMELNHVDCTVPSVLAVNTQGNQGKVQRASSATTCEPRNGSHSAPILAHRDGRNNAPDNLRDMKRLPSRKFNTYVLPTPGDAKNPIPAGSNKGPGRWPNINAQTNTLYHSLPLAPKEQAGNYAADRSSVPQLSKSQSVLKESNVNNVTSRASVHLGEGISLHNYDWRNSSDTKKLKRHAFSAPLRSKLLSGTPAPSAGDPTASPDHPGLVSRFFLRVPVSESVVSPRVSSSSLPSITSSPRISELHELPRPPEVRTRKDVSSKTSLVTHSAPLVSRSQQRSLAVISQTASPLPRPPGTMPRSYSIPSRGGQRTQSANGPESPIVVLCEKVTSPPLSPIVFPSKPMVDTAEPITKTTALDQL